jgi:hypothetical protein
MKAIIATPLAALALFAASSLIPSHAKPGDLRAACEADVKALCGNVEPGEGRIAKCVQANKEKLSDACKAQAKNSLEKLQKKRDQRANRRDGNGAGDTVPPVSTP